MISKWWRRFLIEYFPQRDEFDRMHGTRTAGIVSLVRLWDIRSKNKRFGVRCQPVTPRLFWEAMATIPVSAVSLPFVDLGCGKGRGLILASDAGFETITGVEFSAALCRHTRKNLAKCFVRAKVLNQDAAAAALPPWCVLLLNNPFGPEVLRPVLRTFWGGYVIYTVPKHKQVFDEFSSLLKVAEGDGWMVFRRGNPEQFGGERK